MQPIVYHVAVSIDGFIASTRGTHEGFLASGDHVTDYLAAVASYGVVLMGRRTYQFGLDLGVTDPYPHLETYVFSRTLVESPDPKVTIVSTGVVETVRRLRERDGKGIYLSGGGDLASQLLTAGLLDEVVLKVNPVTLGSGIPVFAPGAPLSALQLASTKVYDSGVILTRYRVKR